MKETSTAYALSEAYQVACCQEADEIFDFRQNDHGLFLGSSSTHLSKNPAVIVWETHNNKPLAWVVPNLLTEEEYKDALRQLLARQSCNGSSGFGKDMPLDLLVKNWWSEDDNADQGVGEDASSTTLSRAVFPRLQYELNQLRESIRSEFRGEQAGDDDENESISNIHSVTQKWRVLTFESGHEFPAHQDAMESRRCSINGQFVASKYSVLLDFQGTRREPNTNAKAYDGQENDKQGLREGAIRFYYRQYSFDGPYDYSVDVHVPQGWSIVMEQRADLWYAIQPYHCEDVLQPYRFVAQASLLCEVPFGQTVESMRSERGNTTFRLGPGLMSLFEEEAEVQNGEHAPRGWEQHSFNPKATMWREGRPILHADYDTIIHQQKRLSLSGLDKERRFSTVNQRKVEQSIRESSRRRNSVQLPVGPVHKRLSCTTSSCKVNTHNLTAVGHHRMQELRRKLQNGHCADNDDCIILDDECMTILTADVSESLRSLEEESITFHDTSSSSQKSHQDLCQEQQMSHRSITQVTRKPRKNSMVGQLAQAFESTGIIIRYSEPSRSSTKELSQLK